MYTQSLINAIGCYHFLQARSLPYQTLPWRTFWHEMYFQCADNGLNLCLSLHCCLFVCFFFHFFLLVCSWNQGIQFCPWLGIWLGLTWHIVLNCWIVVRFPNGCVFFNSPGFSLYPHPVSKQACVQYCVSLIVASIMFQAWIAIPHLK